MKIHELEIHNIRGIRQIQLTPKGETFLVFGPNGVGKSSVVDAIDFLLTGSLSRLEGEGTKGITIKSHGRHIDCSDLKDSYVKATVEVDSFSSKIIISRSLAQPSEYVCSPEEARSSIEHALRIAKRKQYMLTRKEILSLVCADGSTRAQKLDPFISDPLILKARSAFVSAQSSIRTQLKASEGTKKKLQGEVFATCDLSAKTFNDIIPNINRLREILGATPILSCESAQILAGVSLPVPIEGIQSLNTSFAITSLNRLSVFVSESKPEIEKILDRFIKYVDNIVQISNIRLLHNLLDLITMGIQLSEMEPEGKCPLCDLKWEKPELIEHLSHKKVSIEEQTQLLDLAKSLSSEIAVLVSSIIAHIDCITLLCNQMGLDIEREYLNEVKGKLLYIRDFCEKYLLREIEYQPDITGFIEIDKTKFDQSISRIRIKLDEIYPVSTPEQSAREDLILIQERLRVFEEEDKHYRSLVDQYQLSTCLLQKFESSRDTVLNNIFREIKDRFVHLYTVLHGDDERIFDAALYPDGAAVLFLAEFYKRGKFPPLALHSEGHQDSMGLCLFLSLSEYFSENALNLIVLDDVVMSVDSGHRKQVCRLLSSEFLNTQFVITTHDQTWKKQLQTEGIVSEKYTYDLFGWDVSTGPKIREKTLGNWSEIDDLVAVEDITGSTQKLRKLLEFKFSQYCDYLKVSVVYKSRNDYTLGDFYPPAIKKIKELLSKAQTVLEGDSAKSTIDEIKTRIDTITRITSIPDYEQWILNSETHDNPWTNFSIEEIVQCVEAYKVMCECFECKLCNSPLRITPDKQFLICACNQTRYPLSKIK